MYYCFIIFSIVHEIDEFSIKVGAVLRYLVFRNAFDMFQ